MQTIKKALANGRLVLLALVVVITLSGCRPAGPQALLDGERLIHEGKYPEAVEKLQVATQYLPKTAQAWNHLGLAYHGAGQPEDARKAYQTALKLDRDLAAARYNLGNLFLEQNQPSSEVAEFTTFTIQRPASTNGWIKLGYAQIGAQQWAAAQKSLLYAFKLAPANPEVLNGLGLLTLQQKNTRDAAGYFNAAIQRQPGYAPALLNLAVLTHQTLRNLPLALRMYQDYLALKPKPANWLAVQEVARRLDLELHPPPPPKP
ncbi:MAG: tetratricopeptide repeat protein, partial [Pedosphaera parvula]|nr:tetratricopeptide repeat protein [Pedosphaera parvula]